MPWIHEDEVSSPKYPEQPDDPDETSGSSSQTVGKTANEREGSQPQQDNPEVTNNTEYPDSQDINTGTPQNPNPTTYSDTGQESTPHKETLISIDGNPGFGKITQGRQNSGGDEQRLCGSYPTYSCPG